MDTMASPTWVVQQIVLQFNIVMRNSGIQDALTQKYLGNVMSILTTCRTKDAKLAGLDPANDPLLRLQYLARLGWQVPSRRHLTIA